MAQVVRRMVRISIVRERRRIKVVRMRDVVGDWGVGRKAILCWELVFNSLCLNMLVVLFLHSPH